MILSSGVERASGRGSNTLPGEIERVQATSLEKERGSSVNLEFGGDDANPEGENDDRSLGKTIPDYSIYGRRALERIFAGHTKVPMVVPSKVLHYRSTLIKSVVKDLSVDLGFP